ncbi:hypothetical protein HUJ04_007059 [Dendroctonus ponderosae]|nr:hypothetical protein HUJ04_007059 [Dendroctonus ponderosae]
MPKTFSPTKLFHQETACQKLHPYWSPIRNNMKSLYSLGDKVVEVDETMIPFRGRLKFRQYNPSKAHRYDIKVFKVFIIWIHLRLKNISWTK